MEFTELKQVKVKKRQIPLFKVSIDDDSNYSLLPTIPHVQEAVMNELILAIKEGVEKRKKSVSIFNISNTPYSLELERDKWSTSLQKVIKYHEHKENFEKCIQCRDLIKQLS